PQNDANFGIGTLVAPLLGGVRRWRTVTWARQSAILVPAALTAATCATIGASELADYASLVRELEWSATYCLTASCAGPSLYRPLRMPSKNVQAIQPKSSATPSNDRARLSSTSLTAYWMPTADASTLERTGIISAPSPHWKAIKNSVDLVGRSLPTECIFAL